MRRRSVLCAAMLVGFVPAAAHAGTVLEKDKIRQHVASATWNYLDASGNSVFVTVGATESAAKGTEPDAPLLFLAVSVSSPGGILLLDGSGSTNTFSMTFNDTSMAHVVGDIDVFDAAHDTHIAMHVDLTFNGTGDAVTTKSKQNVKTDNMKVKTEFKGTTREATVSGVVTDGVTNYAATAPTDALLFRDVIGTMVIQTGH